MSLALQSFSLLVILIWGASLLLLLCHIVLLLLLCYIMRMMTEMIEVFRVKTILLLAAKMIALDIKKTKMNM